MVSRSPVLFITLCVAFCGSGSADVTEPLEQAISLAHQSWGELGIDVAAHAPGKQGRSLRIKDQEYTKGVGTHANSRITVDLWGEYKAFEAEVGVQHHPDHDNGSVVFQVFVDGEKQFDSGVCGRPTPLKTSASRSTAQTKWTWW